MIRRSLFLIAVLCGHAAAGPVSTGGDPASKLVNQWFAEGTAAGLKGVYYDNRDRKHSDLRIATYPQMLSIAYTEEERARRADWGSQRQLLPGKIVVGNSSTAAPATTGGSHPRIYYTHPRGLPFLYEQYRSNALYVYPEHRDHDPGTNGPDGYGDLFPANSPYLISSQGSSGSDRVFMHAVLKTIAAFPPETRTTLALEGLLMPTVQAIFRRTYKAVEDPADYFTGKAHPSAFEGKLIDEVAMVKLAHAMTPGAIPPLVKLRVVEEPELTPGRDFFEPPALATLGERLADSPGAIARVIRGPSYRRTIRVSAADSIAPGDRRVSFRWVVLRGDPDLVTIDVKGERREEAAISVAWHKRRPIFPGSVLWSNRVDIGIFAEAAGSIASAPAFVTFTTLPNEHRTYRDDGRLIEIYYGARPEGLGMPPLGDARWSALLADFERPRGERPMRSRLLAAAMPEQDRAALTALAAATSADRSRLAAARKELAAITAAQQKIVNEANKARLDAAANHKKLGTAESMAALEFATIQLDAAKKVMRDGASGAAELKGEIAALEPRVAAALRNAGAVKVVRAALVALREDPRFLSKHEDAIRAAIRVSPHPQAAGSLAAALRRAEAIGIAESDAPASNERYHLQQRNLDILSEALFPDFLGPPRREHYADPRLTAPKHWRDVYRHDKQGRIAGWTRYHDGTRTEFTASGELIQSGKPTPVRYELDPKTKRLNHVTP